MRPHDPPATAGPSSASRVGHYTATSHSLPCAGALCAPLWLVRLDVGFRTFLEGGRGGRPLDSLAFFSGQSIRQYPDGDGLYLIVASATSRSWSYRYWIGGKERWHGLGSLNDVSLKDARIKRDTARQEVRAGVDIVRSKALF